MLAVKLNPSRGLWQRFSDAAQFVMALYISLRLSFPFLCVCLLSHFFCSSPCWQGPIYQLISAFPGTLPTGSTAGEKKERERERGGGANERKLVNNRRREGCERMRGGWERSMNRGEKERKTDRGGKEDGKRKNNNGGLRKGGCVCV